MKSFSLKSEIILHFLCLFFISSKLPVLKIFVFTLFSNSILNGRILCLGKPPHSSSRRSFNYRTPRASSPQSQYRWQWVWRPPYQPSQNPQHDSLPEEETRSLSSSLSLPKTKIPSSSQPKTKPKLSSETSETKPTLSFLLPLLLLLPRHFSKVARRCRRERSPVVW